MKRQQYIFGLICLFTAASTVYASEENDSTSANAYIAWEQTASMSDQSIIDKIRKALADDSKLAPIAKEIKIFSVNGNVTLRGTTSSEQDKREIENAAEQITGVISINNRIEVK